VNKSTLLTYIAETAYNIGFGGKKHFITYDMLRSLPRLISVVTIIIGVFQLLGWYKSSLSGDQQDLVAAALIAVGVIGFSLDMASDDKDEYNKAGKKLIGFFHELREMYHVVQSVDESADLHPFVERVRQIKTEAQEIAISKQLLFTHWATHIEFFQRMQTRWVVEELKLTWKDKMPIWHWETLVIAAGAVIVARWFIEYLC
jgi:hypothetical protein